MKAKLETLDKNDLLIGLESTAHYAENLIFSLHAQGYRLAVINPVQTAAVRKTGIRKTKTDKIDSLLICKTLALSSFQLYTENDVKRFSSSLCADSVRSSKSPKHVSKFSSYHMLM